MAAGVGRGVTPHTASLGAAGDIAADAAQTTDHGTSPFRSPRAATSTPGGGGGGGGGGSASGALRRAAAAGAARESAASERLDVQWLHVNRHRIVNTPASTATAAERAAFRPYVEYEIEVQQFGARPCRVWHRYTAFRDFRDKLAAEVGIPFFFLCPFNWCSCFCSLGPFCLVGCFCLVVVVSCVHSCPTPACPAQIPRGSSVRLPATL